MAKHANECDEIWHAGDWGHNEIDVKLKNIGILRGVYGNIDGIVVRKQFPKEIHFELEGMTIFMTHIGGYPGKYEKGIKEKLLKIRPDLFISGHSHICKVVKDKALNLLHLNPGAIGNKGFHKKRTMMRFNLENGKIFDLKVLEYDKSINEK